jgi:hypothetical protein
MSWQFLTYASKYTKMASLQSLPAPLPLLIAKELPDIKALDSLRQTSALWAAVFARHAVELLEHLMLTTLHEETIAELRVHVRLVADFQRWWNTDIAVDKLYEHAQKPLHKDTPIEAVSMTLRTFSFLHSLGDRVAAAKLQELYALPHYRSKCNYNIPTFYTTEGTPYEVPAPSLLDWTEEQRILKSLFHIRNHALLGLQIYQPPPLPRALWKPSITYECYRLFEDHLSAITQTTIPTTPSCWQAPASRCDDHLEDWPNDSELTGITTGWQVFHTRCAFRSHLRSPMSHIDWTVFSDLGMAIWSHRRLAMELKIVHKTRRTRNSSESRPNFAFSWRKLAYARIPVKNDEYSF